MTPELWERVHEYHAAEQADARERLLCKRGIKQRMDAGIKKNTALVCPFTASIFKAPMERDRSVGVRR